jgi:hypothetical protein
MDCKVGYIYALYHRRRPFYIGQTISIGDRLRSHKSAFVSGKEKLVYQYIGSITTPKDFYTDISIRPLKVVSVYDLDYQEMVYIKYCVDRGMMIYNNCVKTISYKVKNIR